MGTYSADTNTLKRLYRFDILSVEGESGSNVVFRARDKSDGSLLSICSWMPVSEDLGSVRDQFSALTDVFDGAEVWSCGSALFVSAADDRTLKSALEILRCNGLFLGPWPGLTEESKANLHSETQDSRPLPNPLPAPQNNISTATRKSAGKVIAILSAIILVIIGVCAYLVERKGERDAGERSATLVRENDEREQRKRDEADRQAGLTRERNEQARKESERKQRDEEAALEAKNEQERKAAEQKRQVEEATIAAKNEQEQKEAEQKRRDEVALAAKNEQERKDAEQKRREAAALLANSKIPAQKVLDDTKEYINRFQSWMAERARVLDPNLHRINLVVDSCNPSPINVAVSFVPPADDRKWVTYGWWKVSPGTPLLIPVVTQNNDMYFYGRDGANAWDGTADKAAARVEVANSLFLQIEGMGFLGNGRLFVTMFHQHWDSWGTHPVRFGCRK